MESLSILGAVRKTTEPASKVTFSSNPMAPQGLIQPRDHACSSERPPDIA